MVFKGFLMFYLVIDTMRLFAHKIVVHFIAQRAPAAVVVVVVDVDAI